MLESAAGRRRCEYFSCTAALLAHVCRSNTNLQTNYRLPITEATHDKDCLRESCLRSIGCRKLTLIAQRAMKNMTGYFGGYISKKQKAGQFELKKSFGALSMYHEKLRSRNLKSPSAQLAHITNRTFTVLESKGILRAATEEFLLASRYKPHDELAAEFIRTFRHTFFHGLYYVQRYEALKNREEKVATSIRLPKAGTKHAPLDEVAAYGYRPGLPDLIYLSPWEFKQWYKPHHLARPHQNYNFTKWAPGRGPYSVNRKENSNDYVLGEDYIRNEQYIASLPHVTSYPDLQQGDASEACISMSHYAKFRLSWVLIRRNRPVIPCPEITPLPSRKSTKYVRAKLCSIYLRPWTLISSLANSEVPFLTDLDLTKEQYEKLHPNGTIGPVVKKYRKTKTVTTLDNEAEGVDRDMRRAWKDYLTRVLPTVAR